MLRRYGFQTCKEVINMLDKLCEYYVRSRPKQIESMIRQEYEKIRGEK